MTINLHDVLFLAKDGVGIVLGWELLKKLPKLLINGDALDAWGARIEKILIFIGFKREKRFIEKDIKSKINLASMKINTEAEGTVTKKVKISWVDQDNIEAFLRDKKVIVRMRHHENQDKNIVNAIFHYTKVGVLHTGKIYLKSELKEAIDLAITKKILATEHEKGSSMEYFASNILKEKLDSNANIQEAFRLIELMEERGLFTRVLLREVRGIGKILYPALPTEEVLKETGDFFNFIEPFARHTNRDDIAEWTYIKKNIRVGIILVAKKSRLETEGLTPYITRIEKNVKSGCRKIYLFAKGEDNIKAVKMILSLATENKKNITTKIEYFDTYQNDEFYKSACVTLLIK